MEMTKRTQIGTAIIAVMIVIACVVGSVLVIKQKDTQITSLVMEKNHLNRTMQLKDSVLNDVEGTFNEIESNLKVIKEKRNMVSMTRSEGGKTRKQTIIEDINQLNTLVEENNKKLADLEQKLKRSGLDLKSYEKRLQALNETIQSQNAEIAELKKMVEDKNTSLADLNTKIGNMDSEMKKQTDTISYKQTQIVEKTNKLNTAHVVLGTFKELKKEGILDRKGGILGIGSSKDIKGNFDPKYFTELDIRQTKTIPVNAKKAVVLSEHPDSSYKLVEENGQIAYLQIENPEEFWRISKYAVIQVK